MQKCNLFRADLFVENNVGTDAQYNELLSQINLAKLQNTNAVSNSNAGCWRSEARYTNIDWLIIEIKKILDEFVKEYRQDLEYKNLTYFLSFFNILPPLLFCSLDCYNSIKELKFSNLKNRYFLLD
jgi:hypothetical protein